jgi:hypothetical protein
VSGVFRVGVSASAINKLLSKNNLHITLIKCTRMLVPDHEQVICNYDGSLQLYEII